MIRLKQTVIVEGKYDKIKLSNFLDANIISTDGFAIFKNKEKLELIRKIAEKDGIIILTDSDSAGAMIRGHLCSAIDPKYITNVFVPSICGKEKRKQKVSAEGFLGVEGIDEETILASLNRAKITESIDKRERITQADLYELGLLGTENSSAKRKELQKRLSFPAAMSTSQLLTALNALYTKEELEEMING